MQELKPTLMASGKWANGREFQSNSTAYECIEWKIWSRTPAAVQCSVQSTHFTYNKCAKQLLIKRLLICDAHKCIYPIHLSVASIQYIQSNQPHNRRWRILIHFERECFCFFFALVDAQRILHVNTLTGTLWMGWRCHVHTRANINLIFNSMKCKITVRPSSSPQIINFHSESLWKGKPACRLPIAVCRCRWCTRQSNANCIRKLR